MCRIVLEDVYNIFLEEIFKILFSTLTTNQAGISRVDIFEGIKNLELGTDVLLNCIYELLEDVDEAVHLERWGVGGSRGEGA